MQEKRVIPGFGKIVSTDYLSMLSLLFPVVIIGLYIGLVVFGKIPDPRLIRHGGQIHWIGMDQAHLFLYMAIVLVILGVPLFLWRYGKIRHTFMTGLETKGTVVSVTQFKDRGRIEAEFSHGGRTHRIGNPVHLTKQVRAIQKGQTVTIVHCVNDPKKAFIKDLFV
jgi:hypothetical protein